MKKILLAIVIFLINYSAISQSNSCTISVNNIQDNTICDWAMSSNGYNGSFEFYYSDSASFNSSSQSVACKFIKIEFSIEKIGPNSFMEKK